jgi:hypothetical protein
MTLARTRLVVALFGVAVLVAILAGLAVVGGPGSGRRDRRDAVRTDALRQIADALVCHAEAGAAPARPAALGELTPACLAPDAVAGMVDPQSGRAYRIAYPEPGRATVCADFERPPADRRFGGQGAFDAASGCISVTLAAR